MKELVEHTDYRVSCKLNISSHLEVSIWCGLCNKHFRLNQKEVACGNTVVTISNWTSHIKKCIEQSKKVNEKRKQTTIKFIQLPHVQARPPQEITSGCSPSSDCTSNCQQEGNSCNKNESAQNQNDSKVENFSTQQNDDVIMVHEEAAKASEILQDFQKSPPVLVSQEGN